MALTGTRCALVLLVFVWTVVSLAAQQMSGCGTLDTQYALLNLRNVSAGMANVQQLRNFALAPLVAQPRVAGTTGSVIARHHINTWMTSMGWTVEEDTFFDSAPSPYGRLQFVNIIATLHPGRARRVVLACHYDTKVLPNASFVGAIDSAVPCSLLLDSALRLREFALSRRNTQSDLTLQFIFFDGEEALVRWTAQDSLYGSRHLAEKWATTTHPSFPGRNYLQTIEVFILLDLIGTADTHFEQRYSNASLTYHKLQGIEACLREQGYLNPNRVPTPLFTSQVPFYQVADDHVPFLQRGVPVVHLITVPYPSVWHTPNDDVPALDFDLIDNLARILRVFMADLPL